jgi:hypothetical protein
MSNTFAPQAEAAPYDFIDEEAVGPVPNIYRPEAKAVHDMPGDWFSGRTYALAAGEQQRIKEGQENGIARRCTILLLPGSGSLAIANQPEPINGPTMTTVAAAGAHYPMGFTLPAPAAAGTPTIFVLETCAEIWVTAIAAAGVSVIVEGYYGS